MKEESSVFEPGYAGYEATALSSVLSRLDKVWWVELGGTDSLSINYLQPGFDKRPKRLCVISFRVNL